MRQSLTVLSTLPDASVVPSGETAKKVTENECLRTITDVEARLTEKVRSGLAPYDLSPASSAGRMLANGGHHELAVEAYGRFAKVLRRSRDPKMQDLARRWETSPWQHRARLQVEQKQWDDAIASFTKAMALNPDDWRFPAQRGSAYAELRQWEKAASDFSNAIELGSDAWSLREDRGKSFAMLGRWKEAADDFAVVVEHTPDDLMMWWGLAALQLQAHDTEAYKKTCQKAFPRFSEIDSLQSAYYLVYMFSSAPDCGIDRKELTRLADNALSQEDNDSTQLAKGMDDYRSGRFEDALAHLPESGRGYLGPLTHFFRAMASHHLGKSEQARKLLMQGMRVWERMPPIDSPRLAGSNFWRFWCIADVVRREAQKTILGPVYDHLENADHLVQAGKLSEAAGELSKAIALAPNDSLPLRKRGELYVRLSQWKEAAADYAKLVELDPADTTAWLHAAPLLILAGDQSGYTQHCQSMVRRFGDTDDARDADKTIKVSLLGSGPVDGTKLPLETLESALDDASAPVWFCKYGYTTRALAAYRAGNADKAVQSVHKAQESQGYADSPSVQALALSLLAMAQHELGNTQDARQALAQATDLTDQYLPKLPGGELGYAWPDWLIANILHAEAAEKIARTKAPTPEAKPEPNPKTE
jgi:tetratricopeptide (TPR) repeat protein